MKITHFIVLVALSMLVHLSLNGQKIEFTEIKSEDDWRNLLTRADSLNKPVFLDIYATWCGPCKQMDNIVFSDPDVALYYNGNFVNSKIDGESEFGVVLAREFGLRGYPTMYYLASDSFLYTNLVGFRPANFFLEYGKKVDQNTIRLREFSNAFDEGNLLGEKVKEYLELLTELDVKEKLSLLADLYISTLTEDDLSNPENKGLILNSSLTFESELFRIIMEKPDVYSELWGEEEFRNFLEKVFQEALFRAASNKDTVLRDRLGDELMAVYFRNETESVIYGKFLTKKLYHAISSNWDEYAREVENYYANERSGDSEFLIQEVYQVLRNQYSSKELLTSAYGWIEIALKKQESFEPNYLGAIIKIHLEEYDEAEKLVTAAEKLANDDEANKLFELKNYLSEIRKKQ